jgi:antitoxin VapB
MSSDQGQVLASEKTEALLYVALMGTEAPMVAAVLQFKLDPLMTKEVPMAVVDSRTFRSGNSEVVRLPRNVAFGREVELTIVRSGDVLTIYPARKPIGELVQQMGELPRRSKIEARDDEVLPGPLGL